MLGMDLQTVLRAAAERANEQPIACPFCSNKVYSGALRSRPMRQPGTNPPAQMSGLIFVGKGRPNSQTDWFGKNFLSKMLGNRSWLLPGAEIRARSCGKCRKLFLWGSAVDETFVQRCLDQSDTRRCPYCAVALWQGSIPLGAKGQGHARFECDQVPDFHSDWFGHNILDRYVLNRWQTTAIALPAHSCPECHYTEVAGRSVYRVVG